MDKTNIERKRQILEALKERKHQRELQVALLGVSADPAIVIEQQKLAEQVNRLEGELALLQPEEPVPTITVVRQSHSTGITSTHTCKEVTGYYDFTYGYEMLLYQFYKVANANDSVYENFKYASKIENSTQRRYLSFVLLTVAIATLVISVIFTNVLFIVIALLFIGFSLLVASRRYRSSNIKFNISPKGLEIFEDEVVWKFAWKDIMNLYYSAYYSTDPASSYLISRIVTNNGSSYNVSPIAKSRVIDLVID